MRYQKKLLQAVLFSAGSAFLLSCIFKNGIALVFLGMICIALSCLLGKCRF